MSVLIGLLTAIHLLVCLFVIVLVLMQKSRDQGVGAAFGGGITESVFGAGTTTALVRLTIYCAVSLLVTTLLLAVLHSRRSASSGSLMQRVIETAPAKPPASSALPIAPLTPAEPATPPAAGGSAPVATETKPESTPAPAPPAPAGKTP